MKLYRIASLLIALSLFSFAKEPKVYGDLVIDKVINVYDGDTFKCNIKGVHPIIGDTISIRINGIDTPEIRTRNRREKRLGYEAKKIVVDILKNADVITLRNIQRPKYFRILADVYADSINVADSLINTGLAKEYDGGTKNRRW